MWQMQQLTGEIGPIDAGKLLSKSSRDPCWIPYEMREMGNVC